jgi:hypothetical protein
MRKFLIAAVAAAALSIGGEASASQAPTVPMETPQQLVVTPKSDQLAARSGPLRNLLRGLIELERRKNAMLRRVFLNG